MNASKISADHLNLIWSAVKHRTAEIYRPRTWGGGVHEGVRRSGILDRILNSCVYEALELNKFPQLEKESCKYSVNGLRAFEERNGKRLFDRVIYEPAITSGALYGLLYDALGNTSETLEVISEFVWFVGITREEKRLLLQQIPIDGGPMMPKGWTPQDGPFARFEAVGIFLV